MFTHPQTDLDKRYYEATSSSVSVLKFDTKTFIMLVVENLVEAIKLV